MSHNFVQLGSIAEFINGAAFKPEDWGESGLRIIRIQNLTDSNKPFNRTERIVSERVRVQQGDLLVSWSATLGIFEWHDSEEALLNQHIFRVLPNEEKVNKRYLRHGLEGAILDMQKHLHGATMQHVNRGEFLGTKLYLPPLEEQKRIAEILDQAEELRTKRRDAIAQLDTLPQSIFLEMFGDPLINPNNFPIQKLGELCSHIIDCPHSTPTYATKITSYACVRSSDIQNSELIFSDVKYLELEEYRNRIKRGVPQPGDVIYCREGARFGNAALITDDTPLISLGQRMMLFRPEPSKANGEFIWGYLSNPIAYHQALREVGGSASPHINIRDIIAFQIPVPPLSRQCEFAHRLTSVEKLKAAHRDSLSELDALFASLQHRAFRGEL
jgi:type I restriction enzyme S subunit